jgi:chaperonin GroEL
MWAKRGLKALFSAKKLLFGNECLKIIAETADEVGRTAAMTLGPMGRNVVIENDKGEPRITKDGVTVIKHIDYVSND